MNLYHDEEDGGGRDSPEGKEGRRVTTGVGCTWSRLPTTTFPVQRETRSLEIKGRGVKVSRYDSTDFS